MSCELRLNLLGWPQAVIDGTSLPGFVYRKSLALLCYLAVTGRSHSRDWLVGLLWADSTQANARASLRKVLAELRQQLPAHLLINHDEVAFNRRAPYCLDVEALLQHLSVVQQATLAADEAAEVAQGVQLYQGDFLEGFHVHSAPNFEEWVLLQRERLRLTMLEALHSLADHHAYRGDYPQAMQYITRLLELEPAQEEAQRQLMTLLARSGQTDLALRQYETCRQALAEELRVEPTKETTALFRRIRCGEELPAPAPLPRNDVPLPLTPLIGRQAELAHVAHLLQKPSCRLLTVVGPGGSGKTHLALAAAATQVDRFPDGVCYVSLASLQSAAAIVPEVARSLGLNVAALLPAAELQQQLLRHLRSRQMLLVMDSFEHLLARPEPGRRDGPGVVSDILDAVPGIKILATSRARLKLQGEHVIPVGGLQVPQDEDADSAREYGAIELFLAASRRVRPDLTPADDEWGSLIRICRLLRGLPLAILLAAAWVTVLTPAEIEARIASESSESLDLLQADWPDLPPRQRSMRAVFDRSWTLLSERQRELLQRLSVLCGGFTQSTAQHLVGADLRDLTSLADRSLLHPTAGGRYEMHELLRHYALQKLRQSPEAEIAARDRHCAYFSAQMQAWHAELRGCGQQAALAAMAAASENVRAAWTWAIERSHLSCLAQAADGVGTYHLWSARYEEGDRAFELAADVFSREWAAETKPVVVCLFAKALAWRGVFQQALRRPQQARQLLQHSLRLLDDAALAAQPARSERAFALWRLGDVLAEGDPDAAQSLYEESLALYRILADDWGTASVLDALGRAAAQSGDHGAARLAWEESLTLRQELGVARGTLRSLRFLADAEPRARPRDRKHERRERPSAGHSTIARADLAGTLREVSQALSLGQYAEAEYLLDKAPRRSAGLTPTGEGPLGLVQAFVHAHQGRYAEARAQAKKCLALCERAACQWAVEMCCGTLGLAALAEGQYAQAGRWLHKSIAICRRTRQSDDLGFGLAYLALASRGLADLPQAWQQLAEALRLAVAAGSSAPRLAAVQAAALLLSDQGQAEQAVELYTLVSRYPAVANSQWCRDVCGSHIAAVAAALPPQLLESAQARSRSRDLQATVEELAEELCIAPDRTLPVALDGQALQACAA